MPSELDEHGQPVNRAFSWSRLADSRFDELIGVCRGILSDGVLVVEEVRFLRDWFDRNDPVRFTDAGSMIYKVITRVLADGRVDPDEEEEVVTLRLKFIGGTPLKSDDASYSTRLPLDDPEPSVVFATRAFALPESSPSELVRSASRLPCNVVPTFIARLSATRTTW